MRRTGSQPGIPWNPRAPLLGSGEPRKAKGRASGTAWPRLRLPSPCGVPGHGPRGSVPPRFGAVLGRLGPCGAAALAGIPVRVDLAERAPCDAAGGVPSLGRSLSKPARPGGGADAWAPPSLPVQCPVRFPGGRVASDPALGGRSCRASACALARGGREVPATASWATTGAVQGGGWRRRGPVGPPPIGCAPRGAAGLPARCPSRLRGRWCNGLGCLGFFWKARNGCDPFCTLPVLPLQRVG
jgi:hypothetical protein